MKLVIAFVNFNSFQLLKSQLTSLSRQSIQEDHSFRIIIVDNSPISELDLLDDVIDRLSLTSKVTLLANPSALIGSYAHAESLNLALTYISDDEYFLPQDPDFFWLIPDHLSFIFSHLSLGVTALGGPYRHPVLHGDCTFPAAWGCVYCPSLLSPNCFDVGGGSDIEQALHNKAMLPRYELSHDVGWLVRRRGQGESIISFFQRSSPEYFLIFGRYSYECNPIQYYYRKQPVALHLFRATSHGDASYIKQFKIHPRSKTNIAYFTAWVSSNWMNYFLFKWLISPLAALLLFRPSYQNYYHSYYFVQRTIRPYFIDHLNFFFSSFLFSYTVKHRFKSNLSSLFYSSVKLSSLLPSDLSLRFVNTTSPSYSSNCSNSYPYLCFPLPALPFSSSFFLFIPPSQLKQYFSLKSIDSFRHSSFNDYCLFIELLSLRLSGLNIRIDFCIYMYGFFASANDAILSKLINIHRIFMASSLDQVFAFCHQDTYYSQLPFPIDQLSETFPFVVKLNGFVEAAKHKCLISYFINNSNFDFMAFSFIDSNYISTDGDEYQHLSAYFRLLGALALV